MFSGPTKIPCSNAKCKYYKRADFITIITYSEKTNSSQPLIKRKNSLTSIQFEAHKTSEKLSNAHSIKTESYIAQ